MSSARKTTRLYYFPAAAFGAAAVACILGPHIGHAIARSATPQDDATYSQYVDTAASLAARGERLQDLQERVSLVEQPQSSQENIARYASLSAQFRTEQNSLREATQDFESKLLVSKSVSETGAVRLMKATGLAARFSAAGNQDYGVDRGDYYSSYAYRDECRASVVPHLYNNATLSSDAANILTCMEARIVNHRINVLSVFWPALLFGMGFGAVGSSIIESRPNSARKEKEALTRLKSWTTAR